MHGAKNIKLAGSSRPLCIKLHSATKPSQLPQSCGRSIYFKASKSNSL